MRGVLANLVALISIAASYAQKAPRRPQALITSPSVCLSNLECPSTSFCDLGFPERRHMCAKRLPLSADCNNVGGGECKHGHYCTFVKSDTPKCQKQLKFGKSCPQDAINPCIEPLVCDVKTSKCTPSRKTGLAGHSCSFDNDCNQEDGFYCNAARNECYKKKRPGASCGKTNSNHECDGFCADYDSKNPVCMPRQREGGICSKHEQCAKYVRDNTRFDNLICNQPSSRIGTCVRQSKIIRRLGAPCDPSGDRCDAGRGLACLWFSAKKKNICQQNTLHQRTNTQFCTPGSELSTCVQKKVPTICRRSISVSPFSQENFYQCLRKIEILPVGAVCNRDQFVVCTKGSVCKEAPGVRRVFGRAPIPAVRVCVRIVGAGASCKNALRSQCAFGLQCISGKCKKTARQTIPMKDTYAALGDDCSELPCMPGTECDSPKFVSAQSIIKRCLLPVQLVGKGNLCYDTALLRKVRVQKTPSVSIIMPRIDPGFIYWPFQIIIYAIQRCRDGLICALSPAGLGYFTCRIPHGVGSVCENDEQCKGKLRCSPEMFQSAESRKCYDPSQSLTFGAKCDPKAGPVCVMSGVKGKEQRDLKCLKKGKTFTCQIVAELFQRCSPEDGTLCQYDSLVCGQFGICVPKGFK